jgi:hypothetical protein
VICASITLLKLAGIINGEQIERLFGAHIESIAGRPALTPKLVVSRPGNVGEQASASPPTI